MWVGGCTTDQVSIRIKIYVSDKISFPTVKYTVNYSKLYNTASKLYSVGDMHTQCYNILFSGSFLETDCMATTLH